MGDGDGCRNGQTGDGTIVGEKDGGRKERWKDGDGKTYE